MENQKEYMTKTKILISKLENELIEEKAKLKAIRKFSTFTKEDFLQIFNLRASIILTKRKKVSEFVIDNDNLQLITQLYYYLSGSEKFEGDLYKGILIVGKIGSGKTLIMQAFSQFLSPIIGGSIIKIHAKEIVKKGNNDLSKRNLFIDDIGKESKDVNDYGTIKNPFIDLMSERYDNITWTFGTCNYSKESLIEFYGQTIFDRFVEMFNIITLPGNSRRK